MRLRSLLPTTRCCRYETNGYVRIPEKDNFHELRRKAYGQYLEGSAPAPAFAPAAAADSSTQSAA